MSVMLWYVDSDVILYCFVLGGEADFRERLGVHVEWALGLHPDLPLQLGHRTQGRGARPPAQPQQGHILKLIWPCFQHVLWN